MFEQNQNCKYRNGIQLIIFASVLWGTVGIATQIVYQQSDITAFTVGFFRLFLALPVVAILCWSMVGRKVLLVDRRHYLRMVAIGVMLALYQVCYFSSISYVGVSIATLVTLCSAPAIVALLSVVWLKERLTRRMLLAFAFAASGTCLLVGMPVGLTTQGDLITGTLLALGSATGYAIVTLVGKSLSGSVHPVHSTTVSFAAGAFCLLPLAMADGMTFNMSLEIWSLLGYIGLVPTATAYFCFFTAMRHIKASTASVITMLEPLTATLLAWLLFDECLGMTGMLGALLLLAAIAVLYRGKES
jgi:DME family drug/metabolite transporter